MLPLLLTSYTQGVNFLDSLNLMDQVKISLLHQLFITIAPFYKQVLCPTILHLLQSKFSVAKATLQSLMSSEGVVILNLGCSYIENGVVIFVWNQNPSASQNQAYLPLYLSIDLSDAYQPSCQSAIIPICHHAPPTRLFLDYSYLYQPPSCLLAIISIGYLPCFRDF